ncbi:MAG: hypothetical protein AAF693_19160, partial [Bacteroidota bacterium]
MQIDHVPFFTAIILNWIPVPQNDSSKEIVIDSLDYLTSKNKCELHAFVFMHRHYSYSPRIG